ncbi:MAG: metallophosphoesterase [Candidatus Thorarchaeota archaeon]
MNEQFIEDLSTGQRKLERDEAVRLLHKAIELNKKKKNVVRIPDRDVVFVGDLHGELNCLRSVIEQFVKSTEKHIVFLGDYGDRGPLQVETFNTVVALLTTYPERITMLRGNHEAMSVASRYGFRDAISKVYGGEMFDEYCNVFAALPIAGKSRDGLFCCHGGVPEGVTSISQLQSIDRHQIDPEQGMLFQILWNDPSEGDFRFADNIRGGDSRYFGRIAFAEFQERLNIHTMIRAHQVFPEGYKIFFDGGLISVFSATYLDRVNPKVIVRDNENGIRPVDI